MFYGVYTYFIRKVNLFFPILSKLCSKFVDDSRIEKQDSDFSIFVQRSRGKIHASEQENFVVDENHFGVVVILCEFFISRKRRREQL